MNIKLTTVTWYSQLLAIILGFAILALGFYLGQTYSAKQTTSEKTSELDLLPPIMDIPFIKPLLLSGVIETNDVMNKDGLIVVRLDAPSMKAIPLIAQSSTEYKYLKFDTEQPLLSELVSELTNGTKVRFEIVSYRYDRRAVETYDSGTLVGFQKVNE